MHSFTLNKIRHGMVTMQVHYSKEQQHTKGNIADKKIHKEPVLDENIFQELLMNILDSRRTY